MTSIISVAACGCAVERVAAVRAAHQALTEAWGDGAPRRVNLVAAQPFLGERKALFADDRRHRDRDPLFRRPLVSGAVAPGQATAQADRARDPPALRGRGLAECGLALVSRIAQHFPQRGMRPAPAALAGRYPAFVQPAGDRGDAETRDAIELEYPPHHPSLLLDELVVCGRALALADKAVAERSSAEHADLAQTRAMPLAAARALDDLRALVLGDHSLELHQQLILRCRAARRANKQSLDAGARKFLDQQNLVGVASAQPIGRVDQHRLNQPLGRKIAHPLEPGSDQACPANPVVLDHPLRQHLEPMLARERQQCRRLARNRILLALPVRRHACVNRRSPHRPLLSASCRR